MTQHPTQDSQSELRKLYIARVHRMLGSKPSDKELVEIEAGVYMEAIEAYVTTRVKEADRLARIDEHVKLSNARSLNMDIDEWSLHRKEELKAQLIKGKSPVERELTETRSTEYGKWDGLQADNREKIKYELAQLNRSKPMTKSIKDIATDAFMAGRKSMELEFESKGRAIQRPIDAQIKEYTKEIEAIIEATYDSLPSLDKLTVGNEMSDGYDQGVEAFRQAIVKALYGKED